MLKKFLIMALFIGVFYSTIFSLDQNESQLRSNMRPISALQIQRAKEEGMAVSNLLHEVAEPKVSPAQPNVSNVVVQQRPTFTQKPNRPNTRPNIQDPFRDILDEIDLKAFIIPEDLQGLKLLPNLNDYTRYEDQTMDFNDVAENIALSNVKANNFSLSPISGVNMVIINGAILVQGAEDVGIKKGFHVINVIGKENRFQVTNKVTVDGDGVDTGLFLAESAELIFEFINDGSTIPEVYFAPSFLMNLPKNAILKFEGEGIVRLGDGAQINLNGQRVADKNENVTFSNKPTFNISLLSRLTIEKNARATISGIGTVLISKGGKVLIDEPGQLQFGKEITQDDIDGGMYPYMILPVWYDSSKFYTDENVKQMYFERSDEAMLDIKIIDSGLIELRDPSADSPLGTNNGIPSWLVGSNTAILSVFGAKSTLEFSQGGTLTIKDKGKLEINVNNDEAINGLLNFFQFGPGAKLAIDGTGKLTMGPNVYNNAVVDEFGYVKEYYVNWSAKDAIAQGDGLIKYVDIYASNDRGFTGKFIPANAIYEKKDDEIEKIAERLVNTNRSLSVTIVYNDENGVAKFRTIEGVSVEIPSGYSVVSDNKTTGAVTLRNSVGATIVYNRGGNQI